MNNQEKLNTLVRIAQSYVLLYLKEYTPQESIDNVENLFMNCPVMLKTLNNGTSEFGKTSQIGGFAQTDKIVISEKDIEHTNLNNESELNKMLGTIIHEYAHKIRALSNQYGEMFEESFASIFAEVCINNARIKLNEQQKNMEPFEMLNSVNYQRYESQVRALLYILKQHNLDQKLISEYIAGNQDNFIQICIQVFGEEFKEYFDSISSRNNSNSEQLIVELITNYIKQKGLNISNYWHNNNKLNEDNLYFRGSPTLAKAVINSRIDSFSQNDQEYYRYYESSVDVADESEKVVSQERINRIRNIIEEKFSLKGKSIEEIYDTIIDLCSAYIQHQNKDDEESKIFINEIKIFVPDIEDFKNKFIKLRVAGVDTSIFDGLDINSITYSDIYLNINKLSQTDEFGGMKR